MNLFVYGTLKKGGKYHCYLEEATMVAEYASAKGVLYDTGLGYPAMALSESDSIAGELYDIPEELWPALDDLEGYTGGAETDLFKKMTITVESQGKEVEAIVYVANGPKLLKTKIEAGFWDVSRPVLV